jgi:DNA polymerase III delta subunit
MSETHPTIYLFHGDDEYAISQAVDELERKLGDPATASLNKPEAEVIRALTACGPGAALVNPNEYGG